MQQETIKDELLKVTDIMKLLNCSRMSVYNFSTKAENNFPKAIYLSDKLVRWNKLDVQKWLRDRIIAIKDRKVTKRKNKNNGFDLKLKKSNTVVIKKTKAIRNF